ncbi:MAG: ABC transporter substrate-binding protein [Actinobacteria bacterium]|nr:MAG: ABC transporter substrate-binding protein [Actinomycetota bacterium]
MRRAVFSLIVTLTIGMLPAPLPATAQSGAKIPRIGILQVGTPASTGHLSASFKEGMRERGYVEGRHVFFEHRFGESKRERLSEAAAELVRIKVDIIVTSTDEGVAAVKQQTQTIPIVMANSTDPVGTGFVVSLARPGRNITGNSGMSPELSGKRLDLLKEIVPGLARIAMLWNPDIRGAVLDYKETESAARTLHLQLLSFEVTRAGDLDRAFAAMTTGRAEALVVPAVNPLAYSNRSEIARLAQTHRLPSIYGERSYADAGGLIAYGPNAADLWRRAAVYVDKILKGAKPGDLPIEQPTKFDLVINLKTAKALGLTIPPSLLGRADQVIQ